MANVPISSLPAASSVSSTDLIPLVHSSTTVSATPSQILGALERSKVVDLVPADGANTTFTFDTPFTNTIGTVTFTVWNYSGSDNAALVYRGVGTPSKSGFTITVGGGQTGSTVSVHYRASGT